MPTWLVVVAWTWIALSVSSAILVAVDLARGHAQHMWIMDVVWPITALWSGPVGAWAYFHWGRAGEQRAFERAKEADEPPPNVRQPFSVLAAKGTTHCGSGCTLGDVVAELLVLAVPLTIFGHRIFGAWVFDLAFAFAFGIVFQYFTIQPMRGLSVKDGIRQALKADTLSLLAWQIGMYGWMALATFALFHHEIAKASPVFWFMMQLAMFVGFATSYPVNRWLLHRGIKEKM